MFEHESMGLLASILIGTPSLQRCVLSGILVSFIWEVRLNALVQIPPSRLFPLVLGLSWQCLYASKATLLSSGSNPHVDSDPRYIT